MDDDAVIRTLLVDVLTDPGYRLDTANDGAEAIEKLEREEFDLVVTDMVMPKANGLDVLLSSNRLDPDRPVVIITGFPSVTTAVKVASLGTADYVTKPFDVGETDTQQLSVILPETFQSEATLLCESISSVEVAGLVIITATVCFPGDAADAETLAIPASTAIQMSRSGTVW